MNKSRMVVLVAVVLLCPFPSRSHAEDVAAWEKMLKAARLTLVQAIAKGSERCEGVAFHAELEQDGDRTQFSIDVAQGTRTCNLVLDAASGAVVERNVEPEDHSTAVREAKVPLATAVETALRHAGGNAVEAKLSARTGKPLVTVMIVAEDRLVPVVVDGVTGSVVGAEAPAERPFTDVFRVEASEWACEGENPWFSLVPGRVLVLEGKDEGRLVRLTITVLAETRTIDGVETRVVEEREEADGKPLEVSRNFFALSKRTNDVYYFGEEVDEYEDGKVVGHAGAWRSGENGARFGLMMPGTPLLGARYHQETAPGVAMDRAEIVGLSGALATPAGPFTGCLEVEETTPLERGKSRKIYAPGVGLVRDGDFLLVKR